MMQMEIDQLLRIQKNKKDMAQNNQQKDQNHKYGVLNMMLQPSGYYRDIIDKNVKKQEDIKPDLLSNGTTSTNNLGSPITMGNQVLPLNERIVVKSFYNQKEIKVSRKSLPKANGLIYSEEKSSHHSTERDEFLKVEDSYSLNSFKQKQSKFEVRKIVNKPQQ